MTTSARVYGKFGLNFEKHYDQLYYGHQTDTNTHLLSAFQVSVLQLL